MIRERYNLEILRKTFVPRAEWTDFPPAANRAAWKGFSEGRLNAIRRARAIALGEAALAGPWLALPASLYMQFGSNGNRSNYEDVYFTRRQRLAELVLAECYEYKGRFIDEIINGIWAVCEETTWIIPAHSIKGPNGLLPSIDLANQSVDLFATQTAQFLGLIYRLLGPELDRVSPVVCERLIQQVETQVLLPVESRDDFWWLSGRNNWTPWCTSNCLGAAMFIWDDVNRLAAFADRMNVACDRFIAGYAPDGGCDEGPTYWGVAAGALLIQLELLYSRSNGAVSVYDEPLIRNMGTFLTTAHLDGPWFTNFSDAPAASSPRRAVVYCYGKRVDAPEMMDLALLGMRNWDPEGEVDPPLAVSGGEALFAALTELNWIPADAAPLNLSRPLTRYLPDLQVAVLRQSSVPGQGLVAAIKGSHNDASHNHNDVGHFTVMLDGQPGIIDLGTEEYTRQTFSDRRYDLWCIRGNGHNAPLFDGIEQLAGRQYEACDTRFSTDGLVDTFATDMARAYPETAGLKHVRRTLTLDRSTGTIIVSDKVERAVPTVDFEVRLYAHPAVEQIAPGVLAFATSPRRLLMQYDANLFQVVITPIAIQDARLLQVWGDTLYRVSLKAAIPETVAYQMIFSIE